MSRQRALGLLRDLRAGDKIWWNRKSDRVAGTVVTVFGPNFEPDVTPTRTVYFSTEYGNRCVALKQISRRTE